jgi:hypothetical protein
MHTALRDFSSRSASKFGRVQACTHFSSFQARSPARMGRREFIKLVKANEECFQEVKERFAAKIGLTSVLHTPQYNNSSTCSTGM